MVRERRGVGDRGISPARGGMVDERALVSSQPTSHPPRVAGRRMHNLFSYTTCFCNTLLPNHIPLPPPQSGGTEASPKAGPAHHPNPTLQARTLSCKTIHTTPRQRSIPTSNGSNMPTTTPDPSPRKTISRKTLRRHRRTTTTGPQVEACPLTRISKSSRVTTRVGGGQDRARRPLLCGSYHYGDGRFPLVWSLVVLFALPVSPPIAITVLLEGTQAGFHPKDHSSHLGIHSEGQSVRYHASQRKSRIAY